MGSVSRRHRRPDRAERSDGDRRQAAADHGCDRRRPVLDEPSAEATRANPSSVDVPRVSMLSNAKVLAGSGWLGLRDREAFVPRHQADADVNRLSGAGDAALARLARLVPRRPLVRSFVHCRAGGTAVVADDTTGFTAYTSVNCGSADGAAGGAGTARKLVL